MTVLKREFYERLADSRAGTVSKRASPKRPILFQRGSCGKAVELLKEMEEAEGRLETVLQEAEDSGPATEMTAQHWADIENEGLKMLRSGKSA